MKVEDITKELNPLDIVLFHIGGTGDYGHIESIIKRFASHAVVVCFEANSSKDDELVREQYSASGVRTFFVPKCVGDSVGKQQFHVNKYRESSSLFLPSPKALQEHIMCRSMSKGCAVHTWGQNCELDHIEEVETITLDSMVQQNILPAPDVLSIDAQGAELRIMRGGEHCIAESVLCVVSEVEFYEIYQGQDLFCAQMNFLSSHGFRFADMYSKQYWHPAPAAGRGFLTVAEAMFFREVEKYRFQFKDSDPDILLYKLMKLAAIAYAFGRFSYSAKIVKLILKEYGDKAEKLFSSDKSYKPVLEMQQYMQKNYNKYLNDFEIFYKGTWNRFKHFVRSGRVFVRSLAKVHDNFD